ncbi:hypothetical protein GGR58DRAFT_507704 [Xylaria digitata]|nr:hypothetical protein GGR58DRAFT_507704 [Xylaria digitata]
MSLTIVLPLLFESTLCNNEPSWVLDFSFSDAADLETGHAYVVTDKVTLNGFLYHRGYTQLKPMEKYRSNPIFTSAKTLFCTGFFVDSIQESGVIQQSLVDGDPVLRVQLFSSKVLMQRYHILGIEESTKSDDSTSESTSELDLEILALISLFLLQQDSQQPAGDMETFCRSRFEESVGKTFFITKKGFVGIASAPVRNGDSVTLLHDAPVYIILRGSRDQADNAQESNANEEEKHRIVVRAAIDDRGVKFQEWVESFPRRNFQIV